MADKKAMINPEPTAKGLSLMANEGIRLPSDSTVASQKVHRGATASESQTIPQDVKQQAPAKPLLTVVLESRALIEGQKGSLFELVLQNDPKSAPPIVVKSDTAITPGTSLLLEVDDNKQYVPNERPTAEQLKRLVTLELEFWRAHLLPKSGHRVFPQLPSIQALTTLLQSEPNLKPLIQWITQRPERIDALRVSQWLKEFAPLSQLRPWVYPSLSGKVQFPLPLLYQAISQTGNVPSLEHAQTPQPHSAMSTQKQLLTEKPIVADPRLHSLPVGRMPSIANLLVTSDVTVRLSAVMAPNTPIQFEGQAFRITANSTSVTAKQIADNFIPVRTTVQNMPDQTQGTNSKVLPNYPSASISSPTQHPIPTLLIIQSQKSEPTTISMAANIKPAQLAAGVSNPQPTATLPLTSDGTQTNNSSAQSAPGNQTTISQTVHQTLQPLPSIREGQIPDIPVERVPLEIRLSQWLSVIDDIIAQSPVHLHSQIRNKAKELLGQLPPNLQNPIANANAKELPNATKANDDETALLSLRNWLDASVARIQSNALQAATLQWTQPDLPVQQLQIPLIWLGLTHWADIEWWQEKPKAEKDKKTDEKKRRQWRMKIYLTLSPMAPLCADIHWADELTQVTFWSEEPTTLSHLNSLLPKLSAWTEGLGESQLSTKHGMPKRVSEQTQEKDKQHLVDIRT